MTAVVAVVAAAATAAVAVLHHARLLPVWHSKNVSFSEAGSMMYKRGEYCSGGIIKGRANGEKKKKEGAGGRKGGRERAPVEG